MRNWKRVLLLVGIFGAWSFGAIKHEPVEYRAGDTVCQGELVYDDAATQKRPGVVVFSEWWGLNDYPKQRAEQLAKLGYVALAADIYGQGKTTADAKQAGQWAGQFRQDRALLRARAQAAYKALAESAQVDRQRIAAIGYCFGGMAALELARDGAPLVGVIGFHTSVDSPNPADAKNIRGRVLICNGADDTFVSSKEYESFAQEMRQAKVDWQLNLYGNAVHAFTNPQADLAKIPGVAYNAAADRRSWQALENFMHDVFSQDGK